MSGMRNMNDWVNLARLPWEMMTTGLDFMWRVSLPPGYYERYGSMAADFGQGCRPERSESRGSRSEGERSRERRSGNGEEGGDEGRRQDEPDLGGDDVKLVRHKLLYTRRGQERVLETGEELVDYSTTAASYGGLKIAKYLSRGDSSIAPENHRYIRIRLEVLDRFRRESVDYDGRMVDLMEKQVDLLGSLQKSVENAGQRRAA